MKFSDTKMPHSHSAGKSWWHRNRKISSWMAVSCHVLCGMTVEATTTDEMEAGRMLSVTVVL